MGFDDLDVHVAAIVAGDRAAFGRWIAGAERPLRESLRSFAARVDVEAVLQEALLRTWQVAPRLEHDGRPNALLRLSLRITRNLAIDEWRRTRGAQANDEPLEDSPELATTPAIPDPMLRRTILECREKLPNKPAQALDARIANAGAEPDATLAERLGMTTNTFLQNFTRARKLLADCLRARGVEVPA